MRSTGRFRVGAGRLWAVGAALLTRTALVLVGCRGAAEVAPRPAASQPEKGTVVITIVYDNNPGPPGLTPAWGFGCVVQGLDKTILFDTGGDGGVLLGNMKRLGLAPAQIDAVVISHVHGDHTGGLASFLRARTNVPVYIPTGFPAGLKKQISALGGRVIESDDSQTVCPRARTTGTLGRGGIEEEGLCVETADGWVLITGCAHPGVDELAAAAAEVTGGRLCLVVGGFHMGGYSRAAVEGVIARFGKLGVDRVAPCHCTGDAARKLFRAHYGERCTLAGVGGVFRLSAAR
jgi:7,8-dihydropterin-6-yl-methyl-4-(beta-D-ribofuranosyl)aminobenzene 5'-phosphate synthase